MNETLKREAFAALARGWLLTPLRGKVPSLKGWTTAPNLTPGEIHAYIYNGANIGNRTGYGRLAVDVDPGADPELLARLSAIHTPTVRTGRDGRHFYFAGDAKCSVGKISHHVDVRGEGGQVVLPGSIHENGNPYTWIIHPDEAPLAPYPPWLEEMVVAAKKIRKAPEGKRNDTLNRATFRAAKAGAPTRELADAATDAGLEPGEIEATIASATNAAPAVRVFEVGEILVPGEHFFSNGETSIIDQTTFCENVWASIPKGEFYSRYGFTGELVGSTFQMCDTMRFRARASKHLRLYAHVKDGKTFEKEYRNFSADMGGLALAAGPEYVDAIEAITHYPLAGGPHKGWLVLGEHKTEHVSDYPAFWKELLRDFPWKSDHDRNAFVSMMLSAVMRPLIQGPVPPFMIRATRERTGKTKLITDVYGVGLYGRDIPNIAFSDDDTELDKRLFAVNLGAHTTTFFDNVRGKIDSAVFASYTTARTYQSRVLGKSQLAEFPVNSITILTANNPIMSGEMAKRMVQICLESPVDRPEMRTDFVHNPLREHILKMRPYILGALLGMAELAEGPQFTLGGFEEWGRSVGGRMATAGMPLSQETFNVMTEEADDESADVRILIKSWSETLINEPLTCEQLLSQVKALGIMNRVLDAQTERGQIIRMGNALRAINGRVIGQFRVTADGLGSRRQWRLVRV